MTTKKSRKSLNDALATEFVYGKSVESPEVPLVVEPEPLLETEPISVPEVPEPEPTSTPKAKKASRPSSQSNLMAQLIQPVPQKEATVRLTVDLTETQHRKLSILCARTGRKKAEIVRMLLAEALVNVKDDGNDY